MDWVESNFKDELYRNENNLASLNTRFLDAYHQVNL